MPTPTPPPLETVATRDLVRELVSRCECAVAALMLKGCKPNEPAVEIHIKCDPRREWVLLGLADVALHDTRLSIMEEVSKPPDQRRGIG